MIVFLLVIIGGGQFLVPWWLYRIMRRQTENKELLRAILFQLKGEPLPKLEPEWEGWKVIEAIGQPKPKPMIDPPNGTIKHLEDPQ